MDKHKKTSNYGEHNKKKEKTYERKYSSSSSSESDEWVEKEKLRYEVKKKSKRNKKHKRRSSSHSCLLETIEKKKKLREATLTNSDDNSRREHNFEKKSLNEESGSTYMLPNVNNIRQREEWMKLPTIFSSTSNLDRKNEREQHKQKQIYDQIYNPSTCTRELNPHWKDGGDGLPKFRKPNDDNVCSSYKQNITRVNNIPTVCTGWRKSSTNDHNSHRQVGLKGTKIKVPDKLEIAVYPERSIDDVGIEKPSDKTKAKLLTDEELNVLAAKLVKAEIMSNVKLAGELKRELENARKLRETNTSAVECEEKVILVHTNSEGFTQPLRSTEYDVPSGSREKKRKTETHKNGQRVRYFADDDKHSLKQMFENEKYISAEDQNKEFLKMAGKVRKYDDLEDIFEDKIRTGESDFKVDSRNCGKAISEYKKSKAILDNCNKCIQLNGIQKHLIVSIKKNSYISLPHYEPLTEGHCLLAPIRHVPCATQMDENEWRELKDLMQALTKMYNSFNQNPIFFETSMKLNKFPHTYIECVPLDRNDGDLAPMYFKKAIDESELEWSQNKKLVSLKGRDVRKAIPKGLPYFFVSFGMEEGYAHVIEEEKHFPHNFAQEIIGGMLNLDHSKWRKPKRQSFEEQSKRVVAFSKMWRDFDISRTNE